MYYAVIDIETGGLDRKKNAICEIGVVIVNQRLKVITQKSWLIKPYSDLSYTPEAIEVNGLTVEHLLQFGESAIIVAPQFINLLNLYEVETFIGHNIKKFDAPYLDEFLNNFGFRLKFKTILDTLEMSRSKYDFKSYSLKNLSEKLGIINNNPHRALGDCFATLELFKKL